MAQDENDKLKSGALPRDPDEGCESVETDAPKVVTVRDGLRGAAQRAIQLAAKFISTGNRDLDDITGGFRPGEVWVMGAGTNWGKSSWLVSVTDEALKAGYRTLIVTAEDSDDIFFDRLLVRRARVSAKRFRQRCLDPDELTRIDDVQRRGEAKPYVLNAIGKPVEWVTKQIRQVVKEYGIDFVGVDYVQEIESKRRFTKEDQQIAYVARELRACIKQLRITGCLMSQLTLAVDERTGKTKCPNKLSVEGSKRVAKGAEMIVLGWTVGEGGAEGTNGDRCEEVS